jgi:hypothetical protein
MVFLNHIFSYALVEGGLMLALVGMFGLTFFNVIYVGISKVFDRVWYF